VLIGIDLHTPTSQCIRMAFPHGVYFVWSCVGCACYWCRGMGVPCNARGAAVTASSKCRHAGAPLPPLCSPKLFWHRAPLDVVGLLQCKR
jgi:hypothetical protein